MAGARGCLLSRELRREKVLRGGKLPGLELQVAQAGTSGRAQVTPGQKVAEKAERYSYAEPVPASRLSGLNYSSIPAPRFQGEPREIAALTYLKVGPSMRHAAHHDVCRGHGPRGREAEAHVTGRAHLQAEGQPSTLAAPAKPVLALWVEDRAVRVPATRAPRSCRGEQRPQHQQPPAAHPLVPPHLGCSHLGAKTRTVLRSQLWERPGAGRAGTLSPPRWRGVFLTFC